MIKIALILVLFLALLAAAFATRPSQQSFEDFYAQQAAKGQQGVVRQTLGDAIGREYAKSFTYNDHYLWVDVQKDGKTAFTGAFSHWFLRDASAAKPSAGS